MRGGPNSLNTVAPTQFQTDTVTGGATFTIGKRMTGDVRVNWSRSYGLRFLDIDGFGGAEQPPDSLLFPSFANRDNSIFIMSLTGVGNSALLRGVTGNNLQRQQPGQLAGGIGAAGRRLLREELLLNPNHRSLR